MKEKNSKPLWETAAFRLFISIVSNKIMYIKSRRGINKDELDHYSSFGKCVYINR